MFRSLAFAALFCLLATGVARSQDAPAPPTDEQAIRASVAAYAAAFNARDAKALAEMWAAEAVYTNRLTGETVTGRAAIAQQFEALFKEQTQVKLEATTESLQFLSPNVAVEHGVAKFVAPSGTEEIEYTAVYVKQGGRWLLDRVTDNAVKIATNFDRLQPLAWMVGKWVDQSDAAQVVTEVSWTKNRNYLTRSFSIVVDDRVTMAGMQVIGWDAAAKTIRSWTFDSDGGFAEGTWSFKKDRWYVHNKGTLADGRLATAVFVIKPVDADSFTWQSVERTVAGEVLPNVDEILIVREP